MNQATRIRSDRRHWLRMVVCLTGASSLFVLGCTDSSDPSARWEKESAKASEAFQEGRYAEAETLLTAALKEAESFETEDPRLVVTLNNLARLYDDQKKYAEAESLYRRILAIDEKTLGPDNPNMATTLYRLATLKQAQGKYAEAEPFYQRALAIRERVLEPGHPDVIMILESYAAFLRETNRADKAAQLTETRAKAHRGKPALEICPN